MSLDNVLPMSLDSFVTYVLDPYTLLPALLRHEADEEQKPHLFKEMQEHGYPALEPLHL